MTMAEQAAAAAQAQLDLVHKLNTEAPKYNVKVSMYHDTIEINGYTEDVKKFCEAMGIETDSDIDFNTDSKQ